MQLWGSRYLSLWDKCLDSTFQCKIGVDSTGVKIILISLTPLETILGISLSSLIIVTKTIQDMVKTRLNGFRPWTPIVTLGWKIKAKQNKKQLILEYFNILRLSKSLKI